MAPFVLNKQDLNLRYHEVAMITSVITHELFDEIYKALGQGTMMTYDHISMWALEFYEKFGDTDWEDAQENPEKYGLKGQCWDEHIIMWVDGRIAKL